MKRLSARSARTCETATSKRCRCRCGGVLHGAARMAAEDPWSLPEGDAHHSNPPAGRRGPRPQVGGQMVLPF